MTLSIASCGAPPCSSSQFLYTTLWPPLYRIAGDHIYTFTEKHVRLDDWHVCRKLPLFEKLRKHPWTSTGCRSIQRAFSWQSCCCTLLRCLYMSCQRLCVFSFSYELCGPLHIPFQRREEERKASYFMKLLVQMSASWPQIFWPTRPRLYGLGGISRDLLLLVLVRLRFCLRLQFFCDKELSPDTAAISGISEYHCPEHGTHPFQTRIEKQFLGKHMYCIVCHANNKT